MKKILILSILIFLTLPLCSALKVEREMIPAVDFNQTIKITFLIDPEGITNFEFTDAVPMGWDLVSWQVEGIASKDVFFSSETTVYLDEPKEIYKWKFENVEGMVRLTYYAKASTIGEQKLIALWKYDDTFESQESTIFVREVGIVCGNNICESAYGENNLNCPADCRFKSNTFFWLSILLLATFTLVGGVAYRGIKKLKKRATKRISRGPRKVIELVVVGKPQKVKLVKQKIKKTKKVKKVKPKLKKIKKPKKTTKKKRTKKRDRHEKFYKETISRLRKIKKELR